MKSLILLCVVFLYSFQAHARESQGDFWLLKTDNKTSNALINAISDNKLEPAAFGLRVTQLIKERKITELAKFNRQLGGGVTKMEKPEDSLKIREIDEIIRMGIFLETEAVFHGDMQACDLRFVANIYEKQKRLGYYFKSVTTALTIINNDWQLFHHWTNETESILLIARIPELPKRVKNGQIAPSNIRTDVDLLQVSQFDLDKFKKSTPATRSKAVTWLKSRSKLLASTTLASRSGEKAAHQDHLCTLYDAGGWTTAFLGFLFEIETTLGREKIDLTVKAQWQNPEKFKEIPDYRFTFAKTIPSDLPYVVEPTTKPKRKADPIILIITARAGN